MDYIRRYTDGHQTGVTNLSEYSGSVLEKNLAGKPGLLLVDDDPLIVESLGLVLQKNYSLITAETRKQAIKQIQALPELPPLALIDLGLPPKPHSVEEGFALIHDLLGYNRNIKILVLSGQNEQENIRHALTLGAVDFIPKPCDATLLQTRLQHQLMMVEAEQEEDTRDLSTERLLGESQAVKTLKSLVEQFADTPFPVLIEGESGVGKELVAQSLHSMSSRSRYPFLTLNCAAFTAELLEAQLFGYCKGAFTGATTNKAGFFEETSEGSLFLDEIGELPLDLQSKLLRVLENGEYYRVGETRPHISNARIIAATNRDLKESVQAGVFRQDLYHRLSVLTINVPPLRERGDDPLLLLNHFIKFYAQGGPAFELDESALALLKDYDFPGNIRELRNIVIRLGAKYPGECVSKDQLAGELELAVSGMTHIQGPDFDEIARKELQDSDFILDQTLGEWERRYIYIALEMANGNLSKAARLLGINRTTLYSRMQRLGIEEQG